jgi:glycosyltransferase involved in cell wall biosynthesis
LTILALNEAPQSAWRYEDLPNIRYQGFGNSKIGFAAQVWKEMLSKRPHLVFCDHVNVASAITPASVMRLTRLVVRLNGIEVFDPLPSIEGQVGLRGADQLLAISDYTRVRIVERYTNLKVTTCDLSLQPNIHTIHDVPVASLELEAVDGTLQPLGSQVILHVGRMAASEQYKGQDTLIRAMPHVLAKHPQAQLVFVGRGDDRERLISLARAQDAATQRAIFFTGFVEQATLEALYGSCYAFAMPSRGEGFGLVYIEAMRYGKPCIGSAVDAASTIIQHEKTGFLVRDPSDPVECADYVSKLLSAPDLARQMGDAGRQRVADYYLFEHFQARFLSALGLA